MASTLWTPCFAQDDKATSKPDGQECPSHTNVNSRFLTGPSAGFGMTNNDEKPLDRSAEALCHPEVQNPYTSKVKIPTQAKRRLGWGALFRSAGSRSLQQVPPCSLRSRVGMTQIMVLVVARGLQDNPRRRRLGWSAEDLVGARLRGRSRGAFVWPGGGDRSGAWVGGCRFLRGLCTRR